MVTLNDLIDMKKLIAFLFSFAAILITSVIMGQIGEGIMVAAVASTAIARGTTEDIRSLYDFQFKPSVMNKLSRAYGQGFTLINEFRNAAGRETMVSNEVMTAQEEDFWHRTITTGSISSGGATAGASATFPLSSDDVDSDGNYYPREKFSIWVKNGTSFVECRIDDIAVTAGPTVTLTVTPWDTNKTIGSIASTPFLAQQLSSPYH